MKRRLIGDKPPDEQRIARLIADLDNDTFATRAKASLELGKLGVMHFARMSCQTEQNKNHAGERT